MNYSLENDIGTLVQFNLKTGIEYVDGEEYRPLSSTGILLRVPKIEDEYPENVEIIGNSTKATNGSDIAKDFEVKYDKENGELRIVVANKQDDDGNIYNQNIEGARDEYTIICHYSSNCYNNENIERELQIVGDIQTSIADYDETEKRMDVDETYVVSENISGLISTNVMTSDIYNGYINSNKQNETNYKTEYIENLEINISKKEISDEIIIDTKNSFIDNKDNIEETLDIDL